MNKKIFGSTILVSVITVIACIVFICGILFEHFETQLIKELKNEAGYISAAIEKEGTDYLSNFDNTEKRITIVSEDGTVIADNQADAKVMENHSDREEIRKALNAGSGTSVRYSETLTEKEIYYAEKMNNGMILRVSARQYSVVSILMGLLNPIAVILFLMIILSVILSNRISKSIVEPINHLDLDDPQKNNVYEELAPLLSKIESQKRTIENQLKKAGKQQEEFRAITENMSEGIILADKNKQILTYNKAALRLFKISSPVSGNVLAFNRTSDFREAVDSALRGVKCEKQMVTDDKTYSLISNPVFHRVSETELEIIGAVIIILDITESVRREQMRREFTSNVSHELKTPLTSISGFAEMMMNGDMPSETVADFSKSIYDEAQRLTSLVLDIIRISEFDEKNVVYEKEMVDLYSLSQSIALRLLPQANRRGVDITVNGEGTFVEAVPKIIEQMIFNLCDNAVKYNRDNGTVKVIISETEETAAVTVKDTGIGIPEAHHSRIFERFYRVDKARSRSTGGTGLGLSIVKHGARIHDAEIKLESEPEKGTSVTLIFPKKKNL